VQSGGIPDGNDATREEKIRTILTSQAKKRREELS
jgi:hypothetical protein